ncbi:MAG TPA: SDR family oxidoreductase [Thermoanaerobaculia bacterium]|jgi:uncharacterized protein YbjT (DUF2867 family)
MILVTGAGGTVGSEVVQQLQRAGAKFRVAHHSQKKAADARARGLDAVVIDYDDPESVRAGLDGVERMFLLNAGAGNQAEQEINAVNAAKAAGVRHIVKLSVWGADSEAFSFAKVHRPAERAIEASGLAWTFLRPNGFMQNMANYMAGTIKSQGAFYSSVGDARISHIDVRDIAAVAVKTLTEDGHEGKAYSLSGPEALTYGDIAAKIAAAVGREVRYVAISDDDLRAAAVGAGTPEPYADALIDLNRYYRTGAAAEVTGEVRRITGRDPIAFEQYARDYAEAFR